MRSHEGSTLPNDTRQGSSRTGGELCSSCITSSGSHTRQPQKKLMLRLWSWEGTEPLDSERSTVLGRGLYQPGMSVNHSLSSEACEPRDWQDEEGFEGPIRVPHWRDLCPETQEVTLICLLACSGWPGTHFLHPPWGLTITSALSSVAQSCLTLYDTMDCSLLGFSVHGIF